MYLNSTIVVRRLRSLPKANQKIVTFSVCDSKPRSLGKKLWYGVKVLVTRNRSIHVKYESPVSHTS